MNSLYGSSFSTWEKNVNVMFDIMMKIDVIFENFEKNIAAGR